MPIQQNHYANESYDYSGINPGGGPLRPPTPVQPPVTAPVQPPAGALPTVPPGNVPPTTPVPPPEPQLAPLNNYQNQSLQSNYQAPAFQGSNTFSPTPVTAPIIPGANYQGMNGTAPTINAPSYNTSPVSGGQITAPNYQPGNYNAPHVGSQNYAGGGASAQSVGA